MKTSIHNCLLFLLACLTLLSAFAAHNSLRGSSFTENDTRSLQENNMNNNYYDNQNRRYYNNNFYARQYHNYYGGGRGGRYYRRYYPAYANQQAAAYYEQPNDDNMNDEEQIYDDASVYDDANVNDDVNINDDIYLSSKIREQFWLWYEMSPSEWSNAQWGWFSGVLLGSVLLLISCCMCCTRLCNCCTNMCCGKKQSKMIGSAKTRAHNDYTSVSDDKRGETFEKINSKVNTDSVAETVDDDSDSDCIMRLRSST